MDAMTNPAAIPPIDTATDPIGSVDDLRQRWRALMGELGFGEHLVRFAFVGPDRRMITVLSDVPVRGRPTRRLIDGLMASLSGIVRGLGEGHSVAFLLSGPGRGGVSDSDRRWARALAESAWAFDVPIEAVFRANDDAVLLVPDRAAVA